MNRDSIGFAHEGAQRAEAHALRRDEAKGLYAATAMLMAEGRDKGFHFFALHLCVALRELEDQLGQPLDMDLPPFQPLPRRQRASAAMRRLIRGENTG
jgi:hypothetical protein